MLKKIKLFGEQKKILFLPGNNPIQIKGVAGSGKTTVALYRAKHLLDTQSTLFKEASVIIFTFNKTLAAYIKSISPDINGGYQKDNDNIDSNVPVGMDIQVVNFHSWAYKFLKLNYNQTIMQWTQIEIINKVKKTVNPNSTKILNKSPEFFCEEISWIKGKAFTSKDEYIDAKRIGRGTADRITVKDKEVIWDLFLNYNAELLTRSKIDFDDYAILCLDKIQKTSNFVPPYTHIIIDEAQDLNKAQILTISKLVDKETNSLSIIADAAQRIYKSGFVWSEVGINVRGGRTIEFKRNYRNTVHIANAAQSLLSNEKDKAEFTTVKSARKGGEKPRIGIFNSLNEQNEALKHILSSLKETDSINGTVILHRTNPGVKNIKAFLDKNSFSNQLVKTNSPIDYADESIKLCTMSSIKGLEFDNVIMVDVNDNEIPFPPGFADDNDEFHVSTERRLVYTCMTRAINNLYMLSYGIPSRYLNEIDKKYFTDISNK